MEANPVRIVQYFDGEKQSIIPLFQRPYTWGKRNWQSLWLDIMSYYDDAGVGASHFMGAVVSIPAKTVPVGVTKHLVIDGQQRLTTVAIFLCALRDCGDERRAAQIQDYLVNRHYDVNSPDFLKLLPTQGDRASYLQVINGGGVEIHIDRDLVKECYDFFVKSLSGKDDEGEDIDPGRVFDIVKSCLQVVMINLGEADDPYLIFESLNFKVSHYPNPTWLETMCSCDSDILLAMEASKNAFIKKFGIQWSRGLLALWRTFSGTTQSRMEIMSRRLVFIRS